MKRQIIKIEEEKCDGCGLCIPGCPEGALQIIDGKARLVSDYMCDGLGACIGECPRGAISFEEREAEPYDERKVIKNMIQYGENTVKAHLKHLKEHGEDEFLRQAYEVLAEEQINISPDEPRMPQHTHHAHGGGCPGSRSMQFNSNPVNNIAPISEEASQLTHWPIQMHLISPMAPHYRGTDLVMAADCVAFSLGGFHSKYLKGKTLAIACPKLDNGQEIYLEKMKQLIDGARINTLTVMIMQVPCCRGLLGLAQEALRQTERKVPLKVMVVGIQGDILTEEWV